MLVPGVHRQGVEAGARPRLIGVQTRRIDVI